MEQTFVEFAVQALAGIVGVFVGVWLALVAENRRRIGDERKREAELAVHFERAMQSMLGSVIKNMAEARRICGTVDRRGACGVIHEGLECSVWDATQDQFIQLCGSVDKRVLFAQFFNGVRHLQAFCEFHRNLQLTMAGAHDPEDPELAMIGRDADAHLKDLTEELNFCGRLLIADYGQPVHRRLLGMKPAQTTPAPMTA
jgi:hypothetical protein